MARLTKASVEKALLEHAGILSKAAEALGVSRQAVYNFIEKNPELEDVRAEATEMLIDVAEGHMKTAIAAGDLKTIRWYLERQGKNRGYNTRSELTGADGGPVQMGGVEYEVVDPNPEQADEDVSSSE